MPAFRKIAWFILESLREADECMQELKRESEAASAAAAEARSQALQLSLKQLAEQQASYEVRSRKLNCIKPLKFALAEGRSQARQLPLEQLAEQQAACQVIAMQKPKIVQP